MLTDSQFDQLVDQLSLPPREASVLKLLLDGRSERAIGLRLGISRHTVHTYVRRLYVRVDVHSRFELISALVKRAS